VEKNVGNTYSDTEITAEFEFESEETLVGLLKENKNCPFQVQVVYISNTGMKCLRVISYAKEITLDKIEKQELDLPLLGIHANTKTAQLVQQGDMYSAQNTAQGYSSIMQEHVSNAEEQHQYGAWQDQNSNLMKATEGMRPILSGPPSSTSNYKATHDAGKLAAAGKGGAYRGAMENAVGPQSSHVETRATEDTGKYVGASQTATDGYRVAGDVTGPTSAHTEFRTTEDIGKYVGASQTATDGYRIAGDVSGPTSAHREYRATEDTGKYVGASASHSDGYRVAGDIAGPTSAHGEYRPGEDSGKYVGTTETYGDGYS